MLRHKFTYSLQAQSICRTFSQLRPNVFDVGPTLYKCCTSVLGLLGYYSVLYIFYFAQELQPIHIKDEKACKDTQVPNSHESGCRRPRFQGVTSSIRKFPSVLWRQLDLCGRVSTSKKLDEFSRVFFPAVFLLFNVCYWVLYTQPIVFIREEGTIRPRIL